MTVVDVQPLTQILRDFSLERDWDQFHTPRNLAMALAGEVGELLAELQWLRDDEIATGCASDTPLREAIADELADSLIYLARLADVVRVDLDLAVQRKLARNAERYPAEVVRGSRTKQK